MHSPNRSVTLTALVLGVGIMVSGCAPSEDPPEASSPEVTISSTAIPNPSVDPSPSPSETATPLQAISKYEVTLDIPETWSVEADEACEGECNEYTRWNLKNEQGTTMLVLLPNTATSTDGDMNTYEREVLSSGAVPGLTFQPASVVGHYALATDQQSGEQREMFAMAIVDDAHLAERGEQPDLDYFKTSEDAWPMLWVAQDYFETAGYRQDGQITRAKAQEFVDSDDFLKLSTIMKSVRITQ